MSGDRSRRAGLTGLPDVLEFAPVRKGAMTQWEIDFAREKRAVRASWAAVAQMLERCEHDVRLACDPFYMLGEASRG